MAKDILLVDPNVSELLPALQHALGSAAQVEGCEEFRAARARLLSNPPDLLVTNLRLQDYNGLHLVILAPSKTRCIVYASKEDLVLAREVQAAGAFYERQSRLAFAIPSYLHTTLPPRDRRDVTALDRRRSSRGGRRSTDRENLAAHT